MAHVYHPDKNTANNFAEVRFREIHEAYTVLVNQQKRAVYDNERWLSGRFKKNVSALTPATFHAELVKLNRHLSEIDIYRMNRQLLHEYLLFLLSPEKAAVLIQHGTEPELISAGAELFKATGFLPAYFSLPVLRMWREIIAGKGTMSDQTDALIQKIQRYERRRKAYPWLVVVLVFILLAGMYIFSRTK